MTEAEPRPPQSHPADRRRPAAEWAAFVLGLLVLGATVWFGVNLVAKVVLVLAFGYTPLLGDAVLMWRSLLFVAAVLLLALVWGQAPGFPSRAEFRRHPLRWLGGAAVFLALLLSTHAFTGDLYVNDWGFRVEPMNDEHWVDVDHPYRPKALVHTNALGFRDDDFTPTPAPGTTRVVVIGDSYVYGKGVPETEGVIDRRLEAALDAVAPDRDWEVLNAGYPGHGFLSYFELAPIVIEKLHPRVVVISSLGRRDWELFEVQQQFRALGELPLRILTAFGVANDLREAAVLYAATVFRDGNDGHQDEPAGEARITARVEKTLAAAEAAGADVVVWEWYDPFPYFDRFANRPNFHRAGWPEGFPRGWDGWAQDPALAIPNDYHPTGKANALAARALAPVIARIVGADVPADRRPADRRRDREALPR